MKQLSTDMLIIGAGPSGTVAAAMAKKAGLSTLIVEKQRFPRFVIGESLLPKCMEQLDEAGFIEVLEAQGFQRKNGARFLKENLISDFEFSEQFSEGWSWTWQVPRSDFDKTLADEVSRRGVDILYEHTVTDISFNGTDSVTTVKNPQGDTVSIDAKFVIDASGYGKVLPRLLGLDRPSSMPGRTAMFSHIAHPGGKGTPQLKKISIILTNQGVWVWVIPFSNGYTSVGFVGEQGWFDSFSGDPETKFREMVRSEPLIDGEYHAGDFAFEPRTLRGFSSSVSQLYGAGFALTGNSAEFLDPVFSSGVTFAIESGALAAKLSARQIKGEKIDWENDFSNHIKKGVDVFRTYVNAWYDGTLEDIFFSQGVYNAQIRNQICSILAGYVWDSTNPYVRRHQKALVALSKVVNLMEKTS